MKPLEEPVLVVVGGGAAGVFGAARAKTICPQMKVVVVEKAQLLSKVLIELTCFLHHLSRSYLDIAIARR